MPNGFETFPGQAAGKGIANVVDEDFHPGNAPPVETSGLPDEVPVEPELPLPVIPIEDVAAAVGESQPDEIPDDILDLLI